MRKTFWGPKIFLGGLNFLRGASNCARGGLAPGPPLWLRHCYSFFKKVTVGMRLDIKLAIHFKVILS